METNNDMPLNADELERYARHIVLPEIGGGGQQKLKNSRVIVIGAGGLGAPVIQYLAAAGVGTIGIVDDDEVSLSNLQRQVIHGSDRIGVSKVKSATEAVRRLNPHIKVEDHYCRLRRDNANSLVDGYVLVIDGSDNFSTRYMVADVCESSKIPLITGAVGRFDGNLTVLMPFHTDSNGDQLPSYRDLFPDAPPDGAVPSCAEAGVLGALTGVIGTLMAMEAIKVITGIGEPLVGRLLLYDSLSARFETIRYKRRSGY